MRQFNAEPTNIAIRNNRIEAITVTNRQTGQAETYET
jgi:hypothetical protein